MKKFLIGMSLFMGFSVAASAATSSQKAAKKAAVEITTSCGTSYSVTCPSCSTADLVNVALYLDAQDCG